MKKVSASIIFIGDLDISRRNETTLEEVSVYSLPEDERDNAHLIIYLGKLGEKILKNKWKGDKFISDEKGDKLKLTNPSQVIELLQIVHNDYWLDLHTAHQAGYDFDRYVYEDAVRLSTNDQ